MKYLLVSMLVVALAGFNDIAKVNKAKEEAKKAYLDQDYTLAVTKYQYLIDSLGVKDDRAQLNLSHAYLLTQDTTAAMQGYNMLANDRIPSDIRSIANQQMGVITSAQNKKELALEYFKQALRANPGNEEARFNYELIKKELEEQKQQEEEQKDQEEKEDDQQKEEDQEQKEQEKQQQEQQQKEQEESNQQEGEEQKEENKGDQEDQEAQEQEDKGKESEEEEAKQDEEASQEQKEANQEQEQNDEKAKEQKEAALMEKLDNLENMDRDQALMYLEAMKNNEVQYLQQNKRKATKKVDRSKPDW